MTKMNRIFHFFSVLLVVAISGAQEEREWQLYNSQLPVAKMDMCAAEYNNKIYAFGGWNLNGDNFNHLYEFDPATDSIRMINNNLGTQLDPKIGCTMNRIGDRLLIVGGANINQTSQPNCYWFNPDLMTWTDAPPLPRAVSWHSSTMIGTKLYIFFGWGTSEYDRQPCNGQDPNCQDVNFVQVFDTVLNLWSVIEEPSGSTSWPSWREGTGTVKGLVPSLSSNEVILVYGGICVGCGDVISDKFFKDLWVFFPENSTFLLYNRPGDQYQRAFMSFAHQGDFWVFGGGNVDVGGSAVFFNDSVTLNSDVSSFTTQYVTGSTITPRWSAATVAIESPDEKIHGIFLLGGATTVQEFSQIFRLKIAPPKEPSESGSSNKGVVIGAVCGSVAGVLALAGGVFAYLRLRRKSRKIPDNFPFDEIGSRKTLTAPLFLVTAPWVLPQHLSVQEPVNLGLQLSKTNLDFGLPEETQLEIGVAYEDSFTVTYLGQKSKSQTTSGAIDLKLHHASVNHKFSLKCTPEGEKLKSGKSVTFHVQLIVHCTTTINADVAVAVMDSGCCKLNIAKKSVLSTYIDYEDVAIQPNPIGEGGYSKVYVGVWRGTEVAVKILKNQQLSDSDRAEFERETNLMNKLRHPNIVNFIGSVNTPGHLCFVTEYMKLGSLEHVMKTHKLEHRQKLKFSLDISKAMQFLHNSGILHRDLKPANFLVVNMSSRAEVNVKLADFGTSRAIAHAQEKQFTKAIGTPIYMAPEVLSNAEYTTPADVYSFGIILIEISTEETPYKELAFSWDIARVVLAGDRPPIPSHINPALAQLIKDCWAQNPKDRPNFLSITNTLSELLKAENAKRRSMNRDTLSRSHSRRASLANLKLEVETPNSESIFPSASADNISFEPPSSPSSPSTPSSPRPDFGFDVDSPRLG